MVENNPGFPQPQGFLQNALFVLRLNVPVNNFSVMSGWSHRFLGNSPVLSGSKVSCSRTQHGGSRFRTPDLSSLEAELLDLTLIPCHATVKILKIQTPEKFAVMMLKFEQGGFTVE